LTNEEFTEREALLGIEYALGKYPNVKLDERFVLLLANTIKHEAIEYDQTYQVVLRNLLNRAHIVAGDDREAFKAALGKMFSQRREWHRKK
jgi:hypothetical protein